jgi:predicted dehydrogenase
VTADGRLRVAQIGVSDLADLHMTAFVDNRHIAEVYLAEPEEELRRALAARWGIVKRAVADWRDLAAEESADLAHLCGSLRERVEIAGAFLAAGKSVILDAPPAARLADLDAMAQAAQSSSGRLYASLPHLMHPAVRKALEMVQDGDLGELFLGQVAALEKPGTRAEAALSGAGFHAVAVLQRFLGPARSVVAECAAPHPLPPLPAGEGAEGSCGLTLRHGQAALSGIVVSQVAAETRPMVERRLVGTEGMLLIRDDPEDELPLLGFRGEEVIPIPVRQPLHVRPWYVARMLDHFVDCLLEDQDPEVTVAEARAALTTALAARESARTGQRVNPA